MNFKNATLALMLGLLFTSLSLSAQVTTVFSEAQRAFKKGTEFYDGAIYGLAQNEFKKTIELLLPVNEPEAKLLKQKAELLFAQSSVRLGMSEGENLIIEFARKYQPDPIANEALIEIANFYFNDKEYDKALQLFNMIDSYGLPKEQRTEVIFKTGYAHFLKKNFSKAKGHFKSIKNIETEYYYPANYYYGMCSFFSKNYKEAIQSFQKAGKSKKYKPYVPYYITAIHFAEGDYDKVINYGAPKAKAAKVKKQPEISRLVGQAFFEEGDYKEARTYLEFAAKKSNRMDATDYYQLGFVQYLDGEYDKAANNFKKLGAEENVMGQTSMYYLADCYLKAGKKRDARTAFANAGRYNYDPAMQRDANWNAAKLAYELGLDREAVQALQTMDSRDPNYPEAQALLSELFLNTRDYGQAMQIIERMPNRTPKIKEAYQKVTYYRGLQLAAAGDNDGAKTLFYKSLENEVDRRTSAMALYGLGEIAHQQKKYGESAQHLGKFLQIANGMNNLPDGASIHTANYTMGYNYMKQKKYDSALGYFRSAVVGIKREEMFIKDAYVKTNVLADATLRAGDAMFKQNNYNEAVVYYNEAINKKYKGYVYALYQKAIIEGLRGNPTEKIIALERVTEQYPNSEYSDEALLALGNAYQEIGRNDQATKAYKKLVRNFKGKSNLVNQAYLKLGLITYNQGDLNQAIKYYKEVFSNNPEPQEAEGALAALEEIYVDDLGKPDEYLRLRESLGGYDVDTAARDDLNFKAAESQFEAGNYDKAVLKYNAYISKFPNGRSVITAYFQRGESFTVLKDYTKALRDYEFVVDKGASKYYEKALRKAAIISYNHAKDFNKAYSYYSKWESIASTEELRFEAQLGTLRSGYRTNQSDAVYSMAKKVIDNPRASQDQISAANFYLGKMAFDKKDYARAMKSFNEVVANSNNENTAEARYWIAFIDYEKRNLDVALQKCEAAIPANAGYMKWQAKAGVLMADIYTEKGEYSTAIIVLNAMIDSYEGEAEAKEEVDEAKRKREALKARQNISAPPSNSLLEMDETGN